MSRTSGGQEKVDIALDLLSVKEYKESFDGGTKRKLYRFDWSVTR